MQEVPKFHVKDSRGSEVPSEGSTWFRVRVPSEGPKRFPKNSKFQVIGFQVPRFQVRVPSKGSK